LTIPTSEELHFEDFVRYFPHAPTALCIKECARLAVLRRFDCKGPILDVGCGDGLFAKIAFDTEEVWGIDLDANEGRWAQASEAYHQIIIGDITRATLPDRFFATCIANCSLEHVPALDRALDRIYRSLAPGARAYLFVPQRDWAAAMWSVRGLRRLGAEGLARTLQDSVDRTFKHHHLYDERGWREMLGRTSFEVELVEPVLTSATTSAFEAFLLPSIAGWLNKRMTTRWTNFPRLRRHMAPLAFALAKGAMAVGDPTPTGEFLIVCRRAADGA
jgi:SAM-dependent methyltransferase